MSMIREVTSYAAPDGKVFPTEQQAERHAKEVLLHQLEALVNRVFPNVGHRPSVIQAVTLLADSPGETAAQLAEILHTLTYGKD